MVDAVCDSLGWTWALATQPEAQQWLAPEHVGVWDAIVLYDMPGIRLARGEDPQPVGPDERTRAAVVAMLQAGQGIVVTHHALAAWPAWDGWANAIGGRFLYTAGTLRGRSLLSSGYRMDQHHVTVLDPAHPVCAGVEGFEADDELYACPVFEDEVVPLLGTAADLDGAGFRSTYEEVRFGGDDVPNCSDRPPASRLVGWAKVAERSPLVYLQPGHGPETMGHPQYRRLLANAMSWVASPAAHEWAAAAPVPIEP